MRHRRIFRRGKNFRVAVDRSGGGKNEFARARAPHRFEQHIHRGDRVLLEIATWMLKAVADVSVGGEVNNCPAPVHCLGESGGDKGIAAHQTEIFLRLRQREKLGSSSRKIVEPDDLNSLRQQPVDERAADKAGRTRDEDRPVHGSNPMACSTINLGRSLTSS